MGCRLAFSSWGGHMAMLSCLVRLCYWNKLLALTVAYLWRFRGDYSWIIRDAWRAAACDSLALPTSCAAGMRIRESLAAVEKGPLPPAYCARDGGHATSSWCPFIYLHVIAVGTGYSRTKKIYENYGRPSWPRLTHRRSL